jgi:hypothetical protein
MMAPQTWSVDSTQKVVAVFLWKVAAFGQSAHSLVKRPVHVETSHIAERHRLGRFVRAGSISLRVPVGGHP